VPALPVALCAVADRRGPAYASRSRLWRGERGCGSVGMAAGTSTTTVSGHSPSTHAMGVSVVDDGLAGGDAYQAALVQRQPNGLFNLVRITTVPV
jgi:hypothetical protein